MKCKAYVGILIHQGMEIRKMLFVTETSGHNAKWEAGKPAKAFSLSAAKDIVFGLNVNGIHAAVVQIPDTFEPFVNPAD